MSVVSENYPEKQISKENFVDIQRVVGDMLMSSLRSGSDYALLECENDKEDAYQNKYPIRL